MKMRPATGDEAANRLGRGEIVEWCGQRLKIFNGAIHFETELTKVWEPSAQFAKMSDVWSVSDGWMVQQESESLLMFGHAVPPKEPGSKEWVYDVGRVLVVAVYPLGQSFYAVIEPNAGAEDYYDPVGHLAKSDQYSSASSAVLWAELETRQLLEEAVEDAGGKVTWDADRNGEAS